MLRRRLTPADAMVALSWLDLTIAEPTWLSPHRSDAQRVLLIRPIAHERRSLAVTIKWVPARRARSGDDEFWIAAVMCPGQARLRRLQRTGRLRAVG